MAGVGAGERASARRVARHVRISGHVPMVSPTRNLQEKEETRFTSTQTVGREEGIDLIWLAKLPSAGLLERAPDAAGARVCYALLCFLSSRCYQLLNRFNLFSTSRVSSFEK